MSPFCPGLLLADCPSPRAFELRADVERRLAQGESAEAITDDLVRRYGATIRGEPPFAGFGLTFWTALALVGVSSVVILATFARGGVKQRLGSLTDDRRGFAVSVAENTPFAARLDDELRDLD